MKIRKIFSIIVLSLFLVGLLVFSKPVRADTPAECDIKTQAQANVGIPASCETKDVVLDGNITVNADLVKVDQSGNECTDDTVASCDTKRHFNSLTIKNGAKLTHSAVSIDDMGQDTNGDKSLADQTTGTARWKKVDIEVTGTISLESGGKIDVSKMGYPGGSEQRIPNNAGCPPFYIEISTTEETIYATAGKGPGGGSAFYHCERHNDDSVAGGGGYGGKGGNGRTNPHNGNMWPPIPGGINYPDPYVGDLTDDFEFGSGGGAASQHDGGYAAHARGGAGGGRVFLTATRITFTDADSYIVANGEEGVGMRDYSGTAHGGGGSGGTIWLSVSDPNGINGYSPPEVDGGGEYCLGCAEDGTINGNNGLAINAKANGARSGIVGTGAGSSYPQGGGAGGRIAIGGLGGQVTPPQQGKVKVIVTWEELGQLQTVEMDTWLRDVRVQ